jgi:hypothetical protein
MNLKILRLNTISIFFANLAILNPLSSTGFFYYKNQLKLHLGNYESSWNCDELIRTHLQKKKLGKWRIINNNYYLLKKWRNLGQLFTFHKTNLKLFQRSAFFKFNSVQEVLNDLRKVRIRDWNLNNSWNHVVNILISVIVIAWNIRRNSIRIIWMLFSKSQFPWSLKQTKQIKF